MPKLKEKYDIVIIGSGMGGLCSALILAKEGYDVCVLEKNAQIGGTLQTFKRDGAKFDTGVHYVGGLEEGQALYPYFKYFDLLDSTTPIKMGVDAYDIITFQGDDNMYPHAQGTENFIEKLAAFFPDEEPGLRKYVDEIQKVCDKFALFNLYEDIDPKGELDAMYSGVQNVISSCTDNMLLQKVLAGSNFLYAGEDNKSPFYMHALIINSYMQSSYKFKNGGSEISRSLNYSLKDYGGTIVRNAEVELIHQQNNVVEYVKLTDGRKIKADTFISNVHPTETLKLMDYSGLRKSYTNRILDLKNSTSVFTLYIVLKPKSLKYVNYNHYNFTEGDVWNFGNYTDKNWGAGQALFTMPDKNNPEYSGVLTVMAYMRMEELAPWLGSNNTTLNITDRGDGYEEFKERKAQILFDQINLIVPGIREKTNSYYTSTPLTQRDYLNSVDGSLYGVSRDYNYPLQSQISPRTKFKNLFFTGQNIIMHGILGTAIGAVITCGEIIGRPYLVDKIRKSAGINL